MADIRRLDEATVERIAAGEVVERPASVVKELVENSLDADAARVEVAVEAGGTDGIRVSDDGIGMTEAEVRSAVEQHTTSKIRTIDDLEAGVGTLGFRGEALHAIGAVSRLTVRTRPRSDREDVGTDAAARGTELTVEGGTVTSVEPAGCPEGTTVEVRDLFYNVPARRKYLKQDATEFAHVNTVVTSYALANPDVAVSLTHDGRETFATAGSGDRRAAVLSVYGRDVAESMVPVDARADAAEEASAAGTTVSDVTELPDGPLDGVTGLVSHPETNRASRDYLSTYVNGRYVTANAVRDAVVEAYGTQLAPDRYPFAVLFLDLPAGDVDVNVHPRKLDVRFADEEGVRRQVRTAVEDALLDAGLLRSSAPRGTSAPDQAEIAPERSEGAVDADGDDSTPDAAQETGTAETERDGASDERVSGGADERVNSGAEERVSARRPDDPGDPVGGDATDTAEQPGEPAAGDAGSAATPDDTATSTDSGSADSADGGGRDGSPTASDAAGAEPDAQRTGSGGMTGEGAGGRHGHGPGRKFSGGHDQERLGEDPVQASFDSLPSMRILGQIHDTYVVAETADGLVLVDQHAADERVNYERLRETFAGDVTTQALADPVELSLTAREAALFDQYEDALATVGFRAERTGERTVDVRTVPSLVAEAADPDLLRDVLGAFVRGEEAAADTVEAAADEFLADLACYPSVTGNTSLTEGSVRELLAALDDCENPWACPHGRPVVVEFDAAEIEARFERDYPGHGGRRE